MVDESDRIRAFGAGLPGPHDAVVESARQDLLDAIRTEPRSNHAAAAATRRIQTTRRRPAWLSFRRRLAAGIGLAAAALAVVMALGVHIVANPQSALAAQMNRLADVAAAQRWTPLGKGKYLYSESYTRWPQALTAGNQQCSVSLLIYQEAWVARDGSGAWKETVSHSRFTSAADKALCARLGIDNPDQRTPVRAVMSYAVTTRVGRIGWPITDWRAYSTDPKVLLRQVHEWDGGPNTARELLVNVADFLRTSDPPPRIAATLYRATTMIPGVRLLGNRTDQKGQTGIAVGVYSHGKPVYIVTFDPANSRLLAEESYLNGQLSYWSADTKQSVVDSHPDYPHGNQG